MRERETETSQGERQGYLRIDAEVVEDLLSDARVLIRKLLCLRLRVRHERAVKAEKPDVSGRQRRHTHRNT